jgi:phosphoribosylaminoimidazole-succinocarboxamide synthase
VIFDITQAPADVLLRTSIPDVPVRRGKVRDLYDLGDRLLIVATDRISAFDVVLGSGVPEKGRVLTRLSAFWFRRFASRVPDHLLSVIEQDAAGLPPPFHRHLDQLHGRAMLCAKTEVIPIECVVRGYLAGSGWAEYRRNGTVCGIRLPSGLRQCDRLPEPIFTPATKAEEGHDENISFEQAGALVGVETMIRLRDLSLMIYRDAADYAATRGIIIADTKFEFGRAADGRLIWIDEALTPDSSRFWPADRYVPGRDQESFDKQFVRNYLDGLTTSGRWNKQPPGPTLPDEVVSGTKRRYIEAYERLTDTPYAA